MARCALTYDAQRSALSTIRCWNMHRTTKRAHIVKFKSNHTRLMCIQCHHCKGLGTIPRAHPMTVDQDRFVSVTVHNIGIGNLTIATK